MNTMMKVCGVLVVAALTGTVSMADPGRGDHRGDRSMVWHGDHGRGGHDYWDGGRHYGYYRNPRGELVFGLIGTSLMAGVIAASAGPVYVPPPIVISEPPRVVYVAQPAPVYVSQSAPVYVSQPVVVERPIVVQPPMTMTINIQNSNGSFTPVTLRQVGSQWVGPRGEYYDAVPSVGQLRPIYGF